MDTPTSELLAEDPDINITSLWDLCSDYGLKPFEIDIFENSHRGPARGFPKF